MLYVLGLDQLLLLFSASFPACVCFCFLAHSLPMSLTFSLCTPLPDSLVLLQTHGYLAPQVKVNKSGQCCFSYSAPQEWNYLPSDARHIRSSHAFKTVLKIHLTNNVLKVHFYKQCVKNSPLQTMC